jgi:hypothetical protein
MIVVRLVGGLGNQLWQVSFARALEAAGNTVKFDRSYFDTDTTRAYALDHWNTNVEFAPPVGEEIFEGTLRYQPEVIRKYNKDCTFNGYWQSPQYIFGVESLLRQEFTLRRCPSPESLEVAGQILRSNSVFLHIRRTDSLAVRGLAFHGLVPLDYYERAIRWVATNAGPIELFVFSDDIEWCEDNVPWPAVFVDHNSTGIIEDRDHVLTRTEDGTSHEDLWLLSLCKHSICANSSFAWWGAWLNRNPDKIVIVPQQWFVGCYNDLSMDMFPDKWIRM